MFNHPVQVQIEEWLRSMGLVVDDIKEISENECLYMFSWDQSQTTCLLRFYKVNESDKDAHYFEFQIGVAQVKEDQMEVLSQACNYTLDIPVPYRVAVIGGILILQLRGNLEAFKSEYLIYTIEAATFYALDMREKLGLSAILKSHAC